MGVESSDDNTSPKDRFWTISSLRSFVCSHGSEPVRQKKRM